MLTFISSKCQKIKAIYTIFCHCLLYFDAFLVLHLRLLFGLNWVPIDLKAEYGASFYRSRVVGVSKKYVFGGNEKLTCTFTERVILPLHFVGFISYIGEHKKGYSINPTVFKRKKKCFLFVYIWPTKICFDPYLTWDGRMLIFKFNLLTYIIIYNSY